MTAYNGCNGRLVNFGLDPVEVVNTRQKSLICEEYVDGKVRETERENRRRLRITEAYYIKASHVVARSKRSPSFILSQQSLLITSSIIGFIKYASIWRSFF